MSNNRILISVIVPVYNVEKYLHKCVDSILQQSHTNLEIFLVDDGSTDSSGQICDEYAKQDTRIKVFHKPNGGQGSARNMALDIALGEYIMFVDSDDWVEPEFCESALTSAINKDAEIVCFGYNLANIDGEKYESMFTKKPRMITPTEGILELIIKKDVIYNFPCNKIFHRSTISDVRFPEDIRIYEDQGFVYLAFHYAKNIYVNDALLYNYFQREDSSSADWFKPEALKCRFEIWNRRLLFFEKNYPSLIDAQIKQLGNEALTGMHILYKNVQYIDTYNKMKQFLIDNKHHLLRLLPNIRTRLYYFFKPLYYLYYYIK